MTSTAGDEAVDSEERITASAVVDYWKRLGLRPEHVLHGSTVIADFIGAGYSRLVEQTGARPMRGWGAVREAAAATQGDVDVTLTRVPPGAPAAVARMEEYAALGARRFLFIGAAGSLQPDLPIGSLAVPTQALVSEGTSQHYGVDGSAVSCPSPDLAERLVGACRRLGAEPRAGRHWTTDAPYRELVGDIRRHSAAGVLSVDMEVSALFSAASFRGLEAAAILAISDEVLGPWNPGFGHEAFGQALRTAAEAALEAATS